MPLDSSATFVAMHRTAAAAEQTVDSAKQRKAEAAAAELEAKHKAEFATRAKARHEAGAKAAGHAGRTDLYAKHSAAVEATNDFGLPDDAAAEIRQQRQQPEPEGEPQSKVGAKLGGLFGAKKEKKKASEREKLVDLATEMGWDEDMLQATIDGFDGDLAQTRALLEKQR